MDTVGIVFKREIQWYFNWNHDLKIAWDITKIQYGIFSMGHPLSLKLYILRPWLFHLEYTKSDIMIFI